MTDSLQFLETRPGTQGMATSTLASVVAADQLALRIRGGDYHGRVVRIKAAQCTIGAAPDCTLRLTAPGMRPLHCIVLRGEAGPSVRRWSPDTLLNGCTFSDALLVTGDRLQVGPIELEVIDDLEIPAPRTAQEDAANPTLTEGAMAELAGQIARQLKGNAPQASKARRGLAKQRVVKARKRAAKLEAELKRSQEITAGLEAQLAELQAAQSQVHVHHAEIDDRSAEYQRQLQDQSSQLCEVQQRFANLQHQYSQLQEVRAAQEAEEIASREQIATLQQRINEFETQAIASEGLRQQLASAQRELTHLQEQLRELQQQREQSSQDLVAACKQLRDVESQRDELLARLNVQSGELKCRQQRVVELEASVSAAELRFAECSAELNTLRQTLSESEQATIISETNSVDSNRLAELEQQFRASATELATARSQLAELTEQAGQCAQEWSQREQEHIARINSLEKLASTLEQELRNANAGGDNVELANQQRRTLEQQLSAAQRQWNEQRQDLEQQALSAHQQLQEVESQLSPLREMLQGTRREVEERDGLLNQLREEIREQLRLWNQERTQLQAALTEEQRLRSLAEAARLAAENSPEHVVDSSDHADHEPTPDFEEQASPEDVSSVLARWGIRNETHETESVDEPSSQVQEEACPLTAESSLAAENTNEVESPMSPEPTYTADSWRAAQQDPEPEPEPVSRPPMVSAIVVTEPTQVTSQEDESIEAYMARLLKRVRGDAVATAFTMQSSEPQAAAPQEAAPAEVAEAQPAIQKLVSPEEFLPRKSAPEQASDLAAMRELAVNTTRQAISRSTHQRFRKASLGTTLSACALVALSVGLFAWACDTGNRAAWGGCSITLAAGLILMIRRLKMRRSVEPVAPA